MNRLFDQFRVKVSYDCIEINQVNNNSVGLDLDSFKTVDDATQAIDELINVLKSESLDDLISFTIDSYSTIEELSVCARISLPTSQRSMLYTSFNTTETDLNQIKAQATRLVKTKLSESLGIGGLDRIAYNLTNIKTYLNSIKNEFDVIDIITSIPKSELKRLIESNKLVSELRYLSTKDYIVEE